MTNFTNKVVKRLLYDEQKQWHNENNWSIFQDHLLSKGVTSYRHPTTATAALDDKVVFLGDDNQINHFNANPADIAKNIMVSRYGPQWEPVGDVISGSVAPSSRRNVASSADGSVIAMKIGDYDMFHSGPVRIYKFTNGLWKQKGGDITPQNDGLVVSPLLQFMSTSLSYDGSVVAIGAVRQSDDSDTSYRGTVNVYKFDDNSGSWLDRGAVINGERKQDYSGWSTSLSADGSRLAIGAYKNDDSGNESGHVRVYKYSNNQWVQLGSDIVGEIAGAQSGYSVSLSADGSVVAIGAIYNTNNQGDVTGHVRVYEYDGAFGSGWSQRGGNIDGEGPWDGSGNSVSLSADGSVVAIGASMIFNLSDRNLDTGHVRVYRYKPNKTTAVTDQSATNYGPIGWDRIGKDIDGEGEDDFSGESVSLSHDGSVVAIGSRNNNVRVYHYRKYTEDDDKNGVSKFNYASRTVNTNQSKPVIITSEFGTITKPLVGNFYWTQVGLDINQSGKQVSLSDDGTIVVIGSRVYQIAKRNPWVQQGLDIVDDAVGDESGSSVSLNGDGSMLAIGSPKHNGNRGKVDVYIFENSKWISELSSYSLSDGYSSGHSVSLSKSGSVLAVSAIGFGASRGKVDILEKLENGGWGRLGNSIVGESSADQSGWSVSCVDGREDSKPLLVAIGARGNDQQGNLSGHVRVYEYDINSPEELDQNSSDYGPDGWKRVGQDIDGKAVGYESGYSVSLSADGSTLAIGAPNPTLKLELISHVRIFNLVEGEWEQQGGDIEEESAYNVSGWSVSLSGDGSRVAIGAIYNDGDSDSTDDNRGHVRVYQRDPDSPNVEDQSSPDYGPTGWKRVGQDIDGEDAGDLSGYSVSLSEDGKILAIGANISELIPSKAGYTRVYRCDVNNEWVRLGFDFEGELGNESSRSISLSGDGKMLAIGSRKSSGSILNSNENTGHVRVLV
jgi:hypothetical protein